MPEGLLVRTLRVVPRFFPFPGYEGIVAPPHARRYDAFSHIEANLKTGVWFMGKVLLVVLLVLVALVVIGYLLGRRGGSRRN